MWACVRHFVRERSRLPELKHGEYTDHNDNRVGCSRLLVPHVREREIEREPVE